MGKTNIRRTLLAVLFLACGSFAKAADLSEPVILVAKRELRDQLFGTTILIAAPLSGGQHVGFILNRPTRVTLGNMFPDHGPSQKIVEPVYLGGPINVELIFALVQRPDSPGGKSMALMPGLYAVFDGDTVDRIIEAQPDQARFVAGLVAWQPGELLEEVKQGVWYVLEPDSALVLRKPTSGLWEELVQRLERAAKGI
jgi:putative transcriptional regulator